MLDYGIYFAKQSKICLCRDKTLVSTKQGIEVRAQKVHVDSTHAFLHEVLGGTKMAVNFLDKIIDRNELVFRLPGTLKTNLKLYLSLRRKGKYLPEVKCNGRQRHLLGLISRDRKTWNKLLDTDVATFSRMCDALAFDAQKKFELRSEKLDVLRSDGKTKAFAINVHNTFCRALPVPTNKFIEDLVAGYSEMLECVFSGAPTKVCRVTHPFYIECSLYNQLVLKTYAYDWAGLATLNERGIGTFVRENTPVLHNSSS